MPGHGSSLIQHEKHTEQVEGIITLFRAVVWLTVVVAVGDGLLGAILWRCW